MPCTRAGVLRVRRRSRRLFPASSKRRPANSDNRHRRVRDAKGLHANARRLQRGRSPRGRNEVPNRRDAPQECSGRASPGGTRGRPSSSSSWRTAATTPSWHCKPSHNASTDRPRSLQRPARPRRLTHGMTSRTQRGTPLERASWRGARAIRRGPRAPPEEPRPGGCCQSPPRCQLCIPRTAPAATLPQRPRRRERPSSRRTTP
mmetsp:Transcript_35449/g.97892  ORF Transcript_35449/g.97892 Transcript_35449/m.97892 type:complete len:204 (-) Transcript_35449:364-975(-)